MGIGFVIAARSWMIAVVLVFMLLAIYVPVIHGEERFLREKFSEFEDYARRVPRMLPRITPAFSQQGRSGFSFDLYLKHREYNALLGALAMTAALVLKMTIIR
jgi:hypothetical protein